MELSSHTLKSYDQQLSELMQLILTMGEQVHELVGMANRALRERSESLVDESRKADKELNALEAKLEEKAVQTIALQNPMAVDLRFITSALKMSGMLERAGDLAKNNIKRSVKLGDYGKTETFAKLEEMAAITQRMLGDAMEAVKDYDDQKAIAVWKQDDEVDDLYHSVVKTMQQEMLTEPEHSAACTHILFMAKNFERLADYVTDLAKTVPYTVTGNPVTKALLKSKSN